MREYLASLRALLRSSGRKFLVVWIPGVLAVVTFAVGFLETYLSPWIPDTALRYIRDLPRPLIGTGVAGFVVCVFLAFHGLRLQLQAAGTSPLDNVLGREFRKQVSALSPSERAAVRYLAVHGQALPQQLEAHLRQRQLPAPPDPLASVEATTQFVARDFRGHYRINERYRGLLDAWVSETLE